MILKSDLTRIGNFGHPHGICGEINASIDDEVYFPDKGKYLIVEIDGIFVPFFIVTSRRRGSDSWLLKLDDIMDESQAETFTNLEIWALTADCTFENNEQEDGLYAEDLIGFEVHDTETGFSGTISDIDDSTANTLFIIKPQVGEGSVLIPVADEFIKELDLEHKRIIMTLPQGLLD